MSEEDGMSVPEDYLILHWQYLSVLQSFSVPPSRASLSHWSQDSQSVRLEHLKSREWEAQTIFQLQSDSHALRRQSFGMNTILVWSRQIGTHLKPEVHNTV